MNSGVNNNRSLPSAVSSLFQPYTQNGPDSPVGELCYQLRMPPNTADVTNNDVINHRSYPVISDTEGSQNSCNVNVLSKYRTAAI